MMDRIGGGFSLERLAGDASGKEYSRMRFGDGQTAVLLDAHAPFDPERDDWLFFRSYLEDCGVTVPDLYFMRPSSGLLYIEDCGDELLQDRAKGAAKDELLTMYKKALDVLLLMQTEGTRRLDDQNPAKKRKFDAEKYTQELDHAAEWYLIGYLSKNLHPNDQDRLNNFFHRLISPLLEFSTVFTHRDYHSRNIIIKGGEFYVIDFQDARMGPPHYDVASLLFDSYVRLEEDVRGELVEYYKKEAKKTALADSIGDRFEKELCRTALQRNIKALGTFGFQAVSRKIALYAKFMPDTVGYVDRNIRLFDDLTGDAEWFSSLLHS